MLVTVGKHCGRRLVLIAHDLISKVNDVSNEDIASCKVVSVYIRNSTHMNQHKMEEL